MAKKNVVIDAESKKRLSHKILKGSGFLIAILMIIVSVAIVSIGCSSNSSPTTTQGAYSGPEVVYEITGTAASVDVIINNDKSELENHEGVAPGTKYTFDSFPANVLSIVAKNLGETGSVTVNIYYKGKLVKTETAEGANVIAKATYFK